MPCLQVPYFYDSFEYTPADQLIKPVYSTLSRIINTVNKRIRVRILSLERQLVIHGI